MELVTDIQLAQVLDSLIKVSVAFALAFPMAWDREQQTRSLGMRTFPLVAVASCAFLLLGQELAGDDPNARTRILGATVTGIGFLGGGAIVQQGLTVRGTATAAAIWATAAIGAAVAYERIEIAIVVASVAFATLRWLSPLKRVARKDDEDCGDDADPQGDDDQ